MTTAKNAGYGALYYDSRETLTEGGCMKKFNSLFKARQTRVKLAGVSGWYVVKEIAETRKLITVAGLTGGLQRGHVLSFTNKPAPGGHRAGKQRKRGAE